MKNRIATTEQWLQTWTEDYTFDRIQVADINFARSQQVNNRLNVKIDEEHILGIMVWLDDKTHTVDPIVVNRVGSRYFIIDGNHRAQAYKENGRAEIDAYIVEVGNETFEGMILAGNARNSKSLTPKERIELAIQLQRRYGTTAAADQMMMKAEDLAREIRVHEGAAKVQKTLGVKASEWPKNKLAQLNRLDPSQIKALGSGVLSKATVKDVEDAVRAILAVDAVERHDMALKESGRLEQAVIDRRKPGKRKSNGLTANGHRNNILRAAEFIRNNPSTLNDKALMEAVAILKGAVDGPAKSAA